MKQIIVLIIAWFIIFLIGIGAGQSKKQVKLEQKLCQLKQYEYCNNEELEKELKELIKSIKKKNC